MWDYTACKNLTLLTCQEISEGIASSVLLTARENPRDRMILVSEYCH